jgi:hypothetical protein
MKNQYRRPNKDSYMATNYDAAVNSFYLAYYGRPADPAGLAYWSQALAQNNGDFSAIIDAFSTSTEATARFADATPADRIADVYQQLFNRAPDQAGLDYWTKAIDTGTISLADAAIQIMNGAQDTDAQLSTLRQEAAAQFTAAVATSGVPYDGSAAIDAARVLIAAVTPTTSAADITALVTATKSLVQTAHDNPEVIAALAGSGSLTTLLASSSGKADPVAMVEALASVGKAAATDTTALTTLKQGGGMAGIVDSLPAGTSLHDVTQAADQGGLTAVGDIVTPPAPADTTPPAAPKVELVADTGSSATDHLTNNGQVKVSGLEAGSTWQYSADGKTWHTGPAAGNTGVALLDTTATGDQTLQVRSTDAAGNVGAATTLHYTLETSFAPTLALQGADGNDLTMTSLVTNTDNYWVSLHGAKGAAAVGFQVSATGADGSWTDAKDSDPLADGTHFIRYVVTDAAGNTAPSNALKIVMDHALPSAPAVQLVQDTGVSATDHFTSNGQVKVGGLGAAAAWSYSTDGGTTWTAGPAANTDGVALLDLGAGAHSLLVREFSQADGTETFGLGALDYTVQTAVSARLAFQGTDGNDLAATSLLTNTDNFGVNLYGAKSAATVGFQVSATGADGSWTDAKDSDPLADGTHFIRYVVTDLAGNTGATNALEVDMDKTAPAAPKVAFVGDTGASATDNVTSNGQIQVSGIETGATWQYTDDGTHWIPGAAPDTDGNANAWLTNGQHTLQVRVVDAAGNFSAVTSMPYTLEGSAPADGLAFDHIAGGAQDSTQTALARADLVFAYTGTIDAGASVNVQIGAGAFVTATGATIDATAKTITLHDFDLSASDPMVTLSVTSLGGLSTYTTPVTIDGPFVAYTAQALDNGIAVTSTQAGHVYLTDGSNASVQVGDAPVGTATFGVQTTAAQGTLGVGPGADVHTDNGITYGLGTAGADTLTGQYVWGYDGDDHITALGTADNADFRVTSTIYGGAGADTITATTGGSTFVYRAVQESTVAADDSAAHGFDTVTVNTTGSTTHNQVFDFGTTKVDGFYTLTSAAALTGSETGNQLLALINTALGHNLHAGTVEAAYIDFGTGTGSQDVNFLVVDANADGAIDGADYVVKIVGTVDVAHAFVNDSDGHMTLLTA